MRVTVTGNRRRSDLVVPGGLPVADLLPDLVALLGAFDLDAGTPRLLTSTGRGLEEARGLHEQGVLDGAVLQLTRTRHTPVLVHDDLIDAVRELGADPAGRAPSSWAPTSTAVLLVLAAACLTLVGPHTGSAMGVGCIGVLLLAMATLAAPGSEDVWTPLPGWAASGCGAACSVLLLPTGACVTTQVAMAGLGGLLPAVLEFLVRGSAHTPLLPVAIASAATALVAQAMSLTSASPEAVLVPLLLATALAVTGLPALALRAGSVRPPSSHYVDPEMTHEPVDLAWLESALSRADSLVSRLYTAVGLGFVLMAVPLARAGACSACLLLAVAVLVLLRARVHRCAAVGGAALLAGLTGISTVVASAAWLEPTWRGPLAVGLLASGVAMWAGSWLGGGDSAPGTARLLDILEGLVLVALFPLATVGSGLFDWVRG